MVDYEQVCTVQDIITLFRPLTADEQTRASALIPVVIDSIQQAAVNCGRDIEKMLEDGSMLPNVLKSVCVDVIARTLMTSTNQEPMTQFAQSALGYSVSGSFLNPGGGLFIKKTELARLGIKRQKAGVIDLWV